MKKILSFLVLALALTTSFAQATKVGGSGASKIGGSGTTKVTGFVGTFNPQTQGSLIQWNDASVLGLSNGASVVSFTDSKTGSPYTWTASNPATRPTYTTNAQNGKGVVSLDGTQYLDLGGSQPDLFPRTIVGIVKFTDLLANYRITGSGNPGGLTLQINTSGQIVVTKAATSVIATSTGTITGGTWNLIVATIDTGSVSFYINGVAAGTTSHSTTLSGGGAFVCGTSASGVICKGQMGEVQIYGSILNSSDLAGLHNYSVAKWATP